MRQHVLNYAMVLHGVVKIIFENQQEKDAFDFIYEIASDQTSRNGCNDLMLDDRKRFANVEIERENADGTKFKDTARYDFDILYWLKKRTRMREDHEKWSLTQ